MESDNQYNKKGLWTKEEDKILIDYVELHGKGQWNRIAKKIGLNRCGKSCRLRWMNYLSPNVKQGQFTMEEDDLIVRLHRLLGNRWALIAGRVPGRTDNQVKNHWNSHLSKKHGLVKRIKSTIVKKTVSAIDKPINKITPKTVVFETSTDVDKDDDFWTSSEYFELGMTTTAVTEFWGDDFSFDLDWNNF